MGLLETYQLDCDRRLPVRLGSALKVPSYAYPAWGIEGDEADLRAESDRAYEDEWVAGSPKKIGYLKDAAAAGGLDNYAQAVRDAAADAVEQFAERRGNNRTHYLEIGAGKSTEFVAKKLRLSGNIGRFFFTLVEPCEARIEATAAALETYGLRRCSNFTVIVAKDTDIPRYVDQGSQDIVVAVAAIHHHAYLDTPIRAAAGALAPGGILLTADWHSSMWEHPNSVARFLEQEFEWPTKKEDMGMFYRRFPEAARAAPADQINDDSNQQIRRFWRGWETVRRRKIETGCFNPEDDILMLEGHRPAERYIAEFAAAGLDTHKDALNNDTMTANPHMILHGNRLLMLTGGRKPEAV